MKNVQAGRLVNQGFYKSFQPNPIKRAWQIDNMPLIQLLGQADGVKKLSIICSGAR